MKELKHMDNVEFETQGIIKIGSVVSKKIRNKKVVGYKVTTNGYDRIDICAKTLKAKEIETQETISYITCEDCGRERAFRKYCPIANMIYDEKIRVDLCNSCYSKRSYDLN